MDRKFEYIPLSASDFLIAAKHLDTDNFGRLVTIVAKYSADGTRPGPNYMSPEAQFVFDVCQAKIDVARENHKAKLDAYKKCGRRRAREE